MNGQQKTAGARRKAQLLFGDITGWLFPMPEAVILFPRQ